MTNPIAVSQRAISSAQALQTYLSIRGTKDGEIQRVFARFEAEIRADERERAAKVVENHGFAQVDFGEPSDPNRPGIFGKTTFDNRRGSEASIATAIRNQKDHDHEPSK